MTILDTTPPALDLRGMTDAELFELALTDQDAALAEAARRDREDQMARARRALDAVRAEGDRQAYAAYRAADTACRGELLSKAGKAAFARGEIASETDLWRMPLERARLLASEELRDHWLYNRASRHQRRVRAPAGQRTAQGASGSTGTTGGNQ